MSLTNAVKEAYAEPDLDDHIIDTLEMDHPVFEAPIRIAPNREADISLPLVLGGGAVVFTAMGMSITLQGFDDDGPTTGQLQIENVSKLLVPYLEQAVQAGSPLTVTYRAYVSSDLTQPGEVRGGMFLSSVSLTSTTANGTLEASSRHDTQAFPRLTYSLAQYKALHGA